MKFLYVATLVLYLGLASSEGETGDPMADAMKMLQAMNPAMACPQISALLCKTVADTCIDIPGIIDCTKMTGMCSGMTQAICGCISNCGPTCAEKTDCTGKTGVEEAECKAMVEGCVKECEAQCTMQVVTKLVQSSGQMASDLPKQLMGLLSGGKPPAA